MTRRLIALTTALIVAVIAYITGMAAGQLIT